MRNTYLWLCLISSRNPFNCTRRAHTEPEQLPDATFRSTIGPARGQQINQVTTMTFQRYELKGTLRNKTLEFDFRRNTKKFSLSIGSCICGENDDVPNMKSAFTFPEVSQYGRVQLFTTRLDYNNLLIRFSLNSLTTSLSTYPSLTMQTAIYLLGNAVYHFSIELNKFALHNPSNHPV